MYRFRPAAPAPCRPEAGRAPQISHPRYRQLVRTTGRRRALGLAFRAAGSLMLLWALSTLMARDGGSAGGAFAAALSMLGAALILLTTEGRGTDS